LNPKILSGPPFKRKFEQGFPLYFTFSEEMHSEKVKYKGNPCSSFLLKGGLDDAFLKGGPDNIVGFKKGKSSQNESPYISLFQNAFHSF
jgi:hypothetical protein